MSIWSIRNRSKKKKRIGQYIVSSGGVSSKRKRRYRSNGHFGNRFND